MKLIVVLSLLLVVVSGDNNQQPDQPPLSLSEFLDAAQKNINDLASNIKSQLNIPDQETVVNTIKNQSSAFVANVQNYISTVSDEVKTKTPEFEKLWADVKTKLNKVVDDINANGPNSKESAELLQKKFQEGVQTLVKESSNIAKSFKQNSGSVKGDVASFTKKAVDIAVEATHNLNEELKNAARAAGKKN